MDTHTNISIENTMIFSKMVKVPKTTNLNYSPSISIKLYIHLKTSLYNIINLWYRIIFNFFLILASTLDLNLIFPNGFSLFLSSKDYFFFSFHCLISDFKRSHSKGFFMVNTEEINYFLKKVPVPWSW